MGLMPAWFNTNNSSKRKPKKFRSAEEKRQWLLSQQSEFGVAQRKVKFESKVNSLPALTPPPGRESKNIPSRDSGLGVATKSDAKVYTGNKVIGIGTLHKSNAVPIFSDDEAKDISRMRR